jgi:hypothetical protein
MDLRPVQALGFKNIQPPSSAISARKSSPALTIFDRICGHILMNGPSYVLYVARLLPDSTIASGTKVSTAVRRNLSAGENFIRNLDLTGVVGVASPEQMLWGDISVQKLAGYASNHFWRRRNWNDKIEP